MHSLTTKRCWASLAILATVATGVASAQDVFSGNALWNNGIENARLDDGGACAPLATGDYFTDGANGNHADDPMLGDPYVVGSQPNFIPGAGSIADGTLGGQAVSTFAYTSAYTEAGCSPGDPCFDLEESYFQEVCYRGAFRPGISESDPGNWINGWTYYNVDGTGRTDIDYGKPVRVITGRVGVVDDPSVDPDDNTLTWSSDYNYVLRGRCSVGDFAVGATQASCDIDGDVLNIGAGTVVLGENATDGFLVINRGNQINAVGSADAPIIFTTDLPPGDMVRGGWGGVVIHGCAVANCVDCLGGESCESEGGNAGFFCGTDDGDDSGTIRYARVEYAGIDVGTDNELNAWTFNGLGCGTTLEYLQAHMGFDDNFEFFGGKVYGKWWLSTGGGDDGFDWQMGFHGGVQFGVNQHWSDDGDKGIEADNNENDNDAPCRSHPIMANLTLVGPDADPLGSPTDGINIRRGTDASIHNSLVGGWPERGLDVQGASTCARGVDVVALSDCTVLGVADAVVPAVAFKAYPNPVTHHATFAFEMTAGALVDLSVFDVTGRLVDQVARGQFEAGDHSINWDVPSEMSAGVYYYRLSVGGQDLNGKFFRIQ